MSLLSQLRMKKMQAIREKDQLSKDVFSLVISEAQMIAKNKKLDEPTEEDVLSALKKHQNQLMESKNIYMESSLGSDTQNISEKLTEIENKLSIIRDLMPKPFSEEELRDMIAKIILEIGASKTLKDIMQTLKERFFGQYDGLLAAKISKELLLAANADKDK